MFLGVAIGGSLGMPVETKTFLEIETEHGRVTDYLNPDDHKWFKWFQRGQW